jgi:hypothetical protein
MFIKYDYQQVDFNQTNRDLSEMKYETRQKTEWTIFNDEHVASEPRNWEGVIEQCLEYRSYPTILFYEKLDPEEDYDKSLNFNLIAYELDRLLQLGKRCDVLYSNNFEDLYSPEMRNQQLQIEKELQQTKQKQQNIQ